MCSFQFYLHGLRIGQRALLGEPVAGDVDPNQQPFVIAHRREVGRRQRLQAERGLDPRLHSSEGRRR